MTRTIVGAEQKKKVDAFKTWRFPSKMNGVNGSIGKNDKRTRLPKEVCVWSVENDCRGLSRFVCMRVYVYTTNNDGWAVRLVQRNKELRREYCYKPTSGLLISR